MTFMTRDELIAAREQDIRDAAKAYISVTDNHGALDEMTETFVKKYARDSVDAKMDLRNLFRKSPVWNEELDALVINGNRTHEPDYNKIRRLASQILRKPYAEAPWGSERERDIDRVIEYFGTNPNEMLDDYKEICIESMERLAPKAYAEGKKPSRIFKAICVALGVADESAGSEFQRKFAEIADEMSSRKIDFKLFVSINPAHFFTMSNPHDDYRGETLISCHSLNSEYEWKNGCVGYGRDNTSIIAFTVADYTNPDDFYNRKTSRQIYAYEVGNGLLLQSRMYNTSGGTSGVQSETAVYRDLIEREISYCENATNLWKPYSATGEKRGMIRAGHNFGGYKDWEFESFYPTVCIREDHATDCHPITVGTVGLCVKCGCECDEEILCYDCREDGARCEECGRWFDEDDMHWVYDEYGNEIQVCSNCLDNYYVCCDECDEYHHINTVTEIEDCYYVCNDCLERYYEQCSDCGEWHRRDDMYYINNPHGEDYYVCEGCYAYGDYDSCSDCGQDFAEEDLVELHRANGCISYICPDCAEYYDECPECGAHYEELDDGCCPNCGCIMIEDIEDEDEERAEVAYV